MSKPQKQPSGRWRIQWLDHEGERQSDTFDSCSAAAAALRRNKVLVEDIRAGRVAPPAPSAPLFKDFAEEFMTTYVAARNKPSERVSKEKALRRELLPRFGARPLDKVTLRDVERLKAELLGRLAPKTVNNVLAVLGKLLRYAKKVGILAEVPEIDMLPIPRPKLTWGASGQHGVMDFEETERLDEAARSEPLYLAAVRLGQEAGLRAGELRALQSSDVDLARAQATVQRNDYRGELGTPKGGRSRVVPLTARTVEALRAIRDLRSPFILSDADGAPLTERAMDLAIVRLGAKARIPVAVAAAEREREGHAVHKIRAGGVANERGAARVAAYEAERKRVGRLGWGWHALRHAYCSHLIARGAHPKDVQELAGHSSLAITERYMHFSPARARAAVKLLEQAPPAAAKEHG